MAGAQGAERDQQLTRHGQAEHDLVRQAVGRALQPVRAIQRGAEQPHVRGPRAGVVVADDQRSAAGDTPGAAHLGAVIARHEGLDEAHEAFNARRIAQLESVVGGVRHRTLEQAPQTLPALVVHDAW